MARIIDEARATTTGVPPASDSQNLLGVNRRWFNDVGGGAAKVTSADAAHAGTSSGWTGEA